MRDSKVLKRVTKHKSLIKMMKRASSFEQRYTPPRNYLSTHLVGLDLSQWYVVASYLKCRICISLLLV